MIALSTVLKYNQSLKALNVSRPIVFSVEEETTNHFARVLKVTFVSLQSAETCSGFMFFSDYEKIFKEHIATTVFLASAGLWHRHRRQMHGACNVKVAYKRWLQNILNINLANQSLMFFFFVFS